MRKQISLHEGLDQGEISRRRFLKSSTAGLVAGVIATGTALHGKLLAQSDVVPAGSGSSGRRILLKGGMVLSMDAKVGDFEKADVLIEGKKIVAVGPNLKATAAVIDATDRIVMPGLIDTHHHQYQAVLRGIIADALLQEDYNRVINNPGALNAFYQPEDAYAGELLASVSQMRAGVTTAHHTPPQPTPTPQPHPHTHTHPPPPPPPPPP